MKGYNPQKKGIMKPNWSTIKRIAGEIIAFLMLLNLAAMILLMATGNFK